MTTVQRGRFTVPQGSGVVVFLIGMRVNDLRRVRTWWWPPFTAMPRMLAELARRPDSGYLSGTTFVSGRTLMVRQYWRSAEDLIAYAKNPDAQHLPAWRAFNTTARSAGGAVGIFHETFVVDAGHLEAISVDMPESGVLAALGSVPVSRARTSAGERLGSARAADPVA